MNWQDYIEQRPEVLVGKPVIKGTRLSVQLILERLGNGWSEADLLKSFPTLHREHIQAVLAYAATVVSSQPKISAAAE